MRGKPNARRDLQAILTYRPLVLARLKAYIRQTEPPAGSLRWGSDVAGRLNALAGAGKLLRGSLVCYSYTLCGGRTPLPAAVVDTAAAVELAHAALLIHDDITDRDDIRRGQPAVRRQYSELLAAETGRERPGSPAAVGQPADSLALCAGDMTLLLAFELLAGTGAQTAGAISRQFARELREVCAGQMQDIYAGSADRMPDKRTIFALMRAKSADYSVAWPLLAGALLAGQPAGLGRRLYDVGVSAGTMFQIRDDELDVFGQTAKLGKPVGSDIREGKKTLLYYYLWKAAGAAERRQLSRIFGNRSARPAEIAAVRRAMQQHGVPARLQADLDRLERRAGRQIEQLPFGEDAKADLRALVGFCGRREA